MLYQPKVSAQDLLSAKLEMQLRSARYSSIATQALGVGAAVLSLWFQFDREPLLTWAAGMLLLLLISSIRMNSALARQRHFSARVGLYLELIFWAIVQSLSWSFAVIAVCPSLSAGTLDLILLITAMVVIANMAVSAVVWELFLIYLAGTLVLLSAFFAWNAHLYYGGLVLTFVLVGLSLLLMLVSRWMSRIFGEMVETNLERTAMTQDLAAMSENLRLRNLQLQDVRRQLADLSTIDELTGLRNRRGLNNVVESELSRAKRNGTWVAVVIVDVDFFKLYNDTYGHPAGDVVLQRIAEILSSCSSRAGEISARLGGEEFLMLLPGSTVNDALSTAETVRDRLSALAMSHKASTVSPFVTVSQGVAGCVPRLDTDINDLIEAADKALYDSKQKGRDSITLSPFSA